MALRFGEAGGRRRGSGGEAAPHLAAADARSEGEEVVVEAHVVPKLALLVRDPVPCRRLLHQRRDGTAGQGRDKTHSGAGIRRGWLQAQGVCSLYGTQGMYMESNVQVPTKNSRGMCASAGDGGTPHSGEQQAAASRGQAREAGTHRHVRVRVRQVRADPQSERQREPLPCRCAGHDGDGGGERSTTGTESPLMCSVVHLPAEENVVSVCM